MSMTKVSDGAPQAERRKFLEPRMAADERENADAVSVELSSRRTGMSFQRTRMSADRTLMAVIRTSLSLITFGFTIYQFFERLLDASVVRNANAGRNFGVALVVLGVGMIVLGIAYHLHFMQGLRNLREELTEEGLIHGQSGFPVSLTLIIAVLLLLLGLLALASMVFNIGPFN
jgi:putative membrane protein